MRFASLTGETASSDKKKIGVSRDASLLCAHVCRNPRACALTAVPAHAAGIDGSSLRLTWAVPFAGILLSIALCPLFLPHFWHKNFGKVAVFWALCCALPLCAVLGFSVGTDAIVHVLLADYVPFIILWDRSSS